MIDWELISLLLELARNEDGFDETVALTLINSWEGEVLKP